MNDNQIVPQAVTALPHPNLPLLRKVLDHIDAHPEEYEQRNWAVSTACGTAYCVAGTALVISGHTLEPSLAPWHDPDDVDEDEQPAHYDYTPVLDGNPKTLGGEVADAARRELGLTDFEADLLFHESNTREEVQRWAERIAARAGERL